MNYRLLSTSNYFLILLLSISYYSCGSETVTSEHTNATTTKSTPSMPNIVILLADDMGWNDVGYHNAAVKTPYIDAFTKEGIELDRFYAYHSCTPSRVGLMTGRYPGRMGLRHVFFPYRKGGLPTEEETIAEFLAKMGYQHRACVGKWHLGHSDIQYHPLNHGFTYFYGLYGGSIDYYNHKRKDHIDWHRNYRTSYDEGYSTELIAEDAIAYIEEVPENDPFFLYVPFNAPHNPLQAPKKFLDMYGMDTTKAIFEDPSVLPLDPRLPIQKGQGNTRRQTYMAMISSMDEAVGQILDAIDKKGAKDNTLVIFFSDNGASAKEGGDNAPLKGQKGDAFEGGIRVPASLRYPNGFRGQRKVNALMGYIDVFATIKGLLNAQNVPTAKPIDGIDMTDILRGEKEQEKRIFYVSQQALVSKKWKIADGKLFNIQKDPGETQDVSDEHLKTFRRLQQTLKNMTEDIEVNTRIDDSYKVHDNWTMPGTEVILERLKRDSIAALPIPPQKSNVIRLKNSTTEAEETDAN